MLYTSEYVHSFQGHNLDSIANVKLNKADWGKQEMQHTYSVETKDSQDRDRLEAQGSEKSEHSTFISGKPGCTWIW